MKLLLISISVLSFICFSTNASRSQYWSKNYGGSERDRASSIQQTSEGGYIVAGFTDSFGVGSKNIWLLKLDSTGGITWQKTYGGSERDRAYSIQQTSEGGYIVAGGTSSFGAGSEDICLLKLDSTGGITWQKTYGGSSWDDADSIQQTSEGGYIVAGKTYSFADDTWAFKLDGSGNIVWENSYYGGHHGGGSAESIQQTSDGGYIFIMSPAPNGTSSITALKLNNNGLIPNCDIVNTTAAIITDTSVVAQDTTVTMQTSSAIVTVTDTTPQDTMSEVLDCPPFDYDNDGVIDIEDNCPEYYNPDRLDIRPAGGNGCGDACECKGDLDNDETVGVNDTLLYLDDLPRNPWSGRPCTNQNPCLGDLDCDETVGVNDTLLYLDDLPRGPYNFPCPPQCERGVWCVYP